MSEKQEVAEDAIIPDSIVLAELDRCDEFTDESEHETLNLSISKRYATSIRIGITCITKRCVDSRHKGTRKSCCRDWSNREVYSRPVTFRAFEKREEGHF